MTVRRDASGAGRHAGEKHTKGAGTPSSLVRPNVHTAATTKKLRALARACAREADWCAAAAGECRTPNMAKNAKIWRGRARTCWKAVELLEERSR